MSCPITAVTFYWRPGCYFCASLERELSRRAVPLRKLNIWDDPASAAVVRSVAGGHETVPTVVVGDDAMVNPRPDDVVAAVRRQAPHLLDQGAAGD